MENDRSDLLVRIQRLEDLEAIRRVWNDYMISLDSHAWAELVDVFTDDAVVEMIGLDFLRSGADGTYSGGGEAIVRDFYNAGTGQHSPVRNIATGHMGSNLSIDVDGDQATTSAYFWEIVAESVLLVGTYQHRFRRDPDHWRIAHLRIKITYSARLVTSEVWAKPLGIEPLVPLPAL
jgi:SnoaL-like domain